MRIEGLLTRLADAGLGRKGKDLFSYIMPMAVSRGILLRIGLDGAAVDGEIPLYHPQGSLQLIVRDTNHPDGFELISRAVKALTITERTYVAPYTFNFLRPRHLPIVYPLSDGANLEFSVNFDCNFVSDE